MDKSFNERRHSATDKAFIERRYSVTDRRLGAKGSYLPL